MRPETSAMTVESVNGAHHRHLQKPKFSGAEPATSPPADPSVTAPSLTPSPNPKITNLRALSGSDGFDLQRQLILGLADGQKVIVPGSELEDRQYAYSRTIDTLCLYSDAGLAIYEEITKLPSYYLFPAELEILSQYGDEIACRMFGLPAKVLLDAEETAPPKMTPSYPPSPDSAESQRWGDAIVGVNNLGVNGSLNPDHMSTSSQAGLIVELGSGALQKTRHILRSSAKLLNRRSSPFNSMEYKALDVQIDSLVESLSDLLQMEPGSTTAIDGDGTRRVVASGIAATYDEGLAHLAAEGSATTKSLLWLGSSIGNFSRDDAAAFLRKVGERVLRAGDTMVIGIDNCDDSERVRAAYDDPEGVTRRFIMEGVNNAGKALHGSLPGPGGLTSEHFRYVSRWNAKQGRHEAYVRCQIDGLEIHIPSTPQRAAHSIVLQKDELLAIECSYKYTQLEARELFSAAGLRLVQQYSAPSYPYSLYIVERPAFHFPLTRSPISKVRQSPYGPPALQEWETLWKLWDALTLEVIPKELLFTRPIPLRHVILFYLGHIPNFAFHILNGFLNEAPIEPAHFSDIFLRGIDPDVEDPTKITHSHSKVPQDETGWPSLESILQYQDRVRQRIRKLYVEMDGQMPMRLARLLFMIYEHEAMHAETLVYIALQASHLHAWQGQATPDFASLSRFWDRQISGDGLERSEKLHFPKSTLVIGHDDLEAQDASLMYNGIHAFGWDVEHPSRSIDVAPFSLDPLPITNGQYLAWVQSLPSGSDRDKLFLASWAGGSVLTPENISVKTLWGHVTFEHAKEWPATGSAHQLASFAEAKGGRLPTQGEMSVYFGTNPCDSGTGNVGFSNLHPVPPTLPHRQRDGSVGYGSNGGVFEWTSDVLGAHNGYVPSNIYKGYSADFHDGKHLIIMGGSYATLPRLARSTFVNWYQSAYPFALCGARVAYD